MTNEPECNIRPATPADGPRILELVCALADFEQLAPPDGDAQQRLLADAFSDRPRVEIFLGEVDGLAVGYAFVFETYSSFLAKPSLYLEDLFVLPEYRGMKVGYALFQYCVEEAQRRGCGRFEWQVLDWNQHAINFYQRQGAQHMKEWLLYRITLLTLT